MPTSFHVADKPLTDLLDRVMRRYHAPLAEAGVRVGVIMAYCEDGPAVKHGGYPALAKIKPVALKDRVVKNYDAELLIDERDWEQLTDEQRESLLDHELSHLAVIPVSPAELRDNPGGPRWKTDDLGRPKLRSVKGDWNVGDGFAAVVARHGDDAIEYENIRRAHEFAERARREGEAS